MRTGVMMMMMMMMSYLSLRCLDDGGFKEEGVVGLVVVHAGGVVDDQLQVDIILADVDRCPR